VHIYKRSFKAYMGNKYQEHHTIQILMLPVSIKMEHQLLLQGIPSSFIPHSYLAPNNAQNKNLTPHHPYLLWWNLTFNRNCILTCQRAHCETSTENIPIFKHKTSSFYKQRRRISVCNVILRLQIKYVVLCRKLEHNGMQRNRNVVKPTWAVS